MVEFSYNPHSLGKRLQENGFERAQHHGLFVRGNDYYAETVMLGYGRILYFKVLPTRRSDLSGIDPETVFKRFKALYPVSVDSSSMKDATTHMGVGAVGFGLYGILKSYFPEIPYILDFLAHAGTTAGTSVGAYKTSKKLTRKLKDERSRELEHITAQYGGLWDHRALSYLNHRLR